MTELEVENIRPLSEYWCFWNGNSLSFFWLVWVEVQEILTSASCPCHLHTLVLICQFASLQKGQARYMYTRCRAARRAEPPQPKTNNFGFWHVINLLDRKRLEKGSQGSKSGFVLSDFANVEQNLQNLRKRPRDGDFVTLDEQFQLKRFFGTIFKNTEMILVILQLWSSSS